MAKRPPTLTDYAVIAISPALIMLMLGSLVFFLIEVLYQGKHPDRLHSTFFFFVLGTVLIVRISIERGSKLASVYGAALGFATFLALQAFIKFDSPLAPMINIALMALVWWAANKLTWDCTHIDEDRRTSGQGVLAAAGLDANTSPVEDTEPELEPAKKQERESPGMLGWFERYSKHKDQQRKKPHTPGVWVLYFALAALPLFGLGQSLIPASDDDRRRATFQQMAVYVASALGLLVTTTLLGVRKYLRDRGAAMPNSMTAGWLGVGGVLILAFLAIGAVLPRPHSETPLIKLPKSGDSAKNKASKNAVDKGGSTGEGDGASSKTENDPNAKKGSDSGKGDAPGDSKDGDPKSGGDGDKKADGQPPGEKKDAENTQADSKQESESKKEGAAESESKSTSSSKVMEKIGSAFKWLVWIIAALLVIAAIAFFILRGLAPFTKWAQGVLDWFRSLFHRKQDDAGVDREVDAVIEKRVERPPPFSTFSNPFKDGTHREQSIELLVAYTFEVFDAWAWDHGCGREGKETPLEFATRVTKEYPKLETAKDLARLVTQVQYAQTALPEGTAAVLKQVWKEMQNA